MNLLMVETRRALHRRAVRVLISLGLLWCGVAGVVAFVGSSGKSVLQLRADSEGHPAIMTDWWSTDTNEGFLMMATFFLLVGGLFGGVTVAGAEWRFGTITTLLIWEPRRLRLHASRSASAALLAFVISFGLQVIFLASFLPAVLAHGTTAGVDAEFWVGLVAAMLRTSLLTMVAAVLGVALATLGRNTSFALIVVFAWMAVIESLIRGLRPGLSPYLWGENIATVMVWAQLDDVDFRRGPLMALATLCAYAAVVVLVAAASFHRRDIGSAT